MPPCLVSHNTGQVLSAQLVGFHDGGVFGEHVGDFPVGEVAGAEVAQIILGDLGEMGFMTDIVFLRHGHAPEFPVALKTNTGIFLL